MLLLNKYKLIHNKINKLSNNITLIAVSKTFSLGYIKPLVDFGHLHYGENKVQEAIQKWSEVIAINKDIKLHMLGNVQSNKVESAVKIFSFIHSLSSEKIANLFANSEVKLNKQLKYFIQVNIGDEKNKNGIDILLASDFVKFCKIDLKLNILGLMCIPPINTPPDNFFSKLKKLNEECNLKELSMGMSSDFDIAIKFGATYVRIGSSIFGNRINIS
jgi:pyridoxal phosphate enzyme (YggS family)